MGAIAWIGRILGIGVVAWGALMLAATTLTIAGPNDYRFAWHFGMSSYTANSRPAMRRAIFHIKSESAKFVQGPLCFELEGFYPERELVLQSAQGRQLTSDSTRSARTQLVRR